MGAPLCDLLGQRFDGPVSKLLDWFREERFFSPCKIYLADEGEGFLLEVRTARCFYQFFADTEGDYLGAQAVVREPRPGEHWLRARDLADGPFNKETFEKILKEIAMYELLSCCVP